jgi:Leucine-rich repeat (LRR) protein
MFADAALEAAVREHVLSKRGNDQPLTPEDVATISRLVAPGRGIRSLAGLEHCRSLMLVDLTDNLISDLAPLAELNRLQSVTLAGNQIRDISPMEGLTAMQLLDFSRNQVENLKAVSKMTNLRALYVADNRLKSIAPLTSLSKIGALDIAGNAIDDLAPVANLTWLTVLEISDNPVRSLAPLTALPNLSMLIMPNNPLDSLDPLVKMCVEDAQADRRLAPYLKLYLNLQSDTAKQWQDSIKTLREAGVSIHDYRRLTTAPTMP